MANEKCFIEVALMTFKIVIRGQKSKKVRLLMDSGLQKSYVLKCTAEELGLRPVSSETVVCTLFGCIQTNSEVYNKF